VLIHLNAMAHRIRGVRMLDAPEVLRHFTATFAPVDGALVVP
jgi:tryptophanase